MIVAHLLAERADAQRRFAILQKRAVEQAKRQDGDDPLDLQPLLDELSATSARITTLTVQINTANNQNGNMERIATRDQLDRDLKMLHTITDAARPKQQVGFRAQATELRWVPNVDVAALDKLADTLAKQRRELNTAIQSEDWRDR